MTKKKTEKKELQHRSLAKSEIRATKEDDGGMHVKGYAIVYDQWADDGYGGREMVARGAVKKTLKEQPDIRALWNHDSNIVLGRTSNNTLRLKEDDHGLAIDLDLPDTSMGRDAHTLIERGDVDQMSFGFNIIKHSEAENEEDKTKTDFTIEEIRLHEVSPVTFPFYPTTAIGVRSAMEEAGIEEPLIVRTLEKMSIRKPAEPVVEDHSQDNIEEPPAEGHSGEEQDKPQERKADEPSDDAHLEATNEEDNTTVLPEVDAETSTGDLHPVSKALIKSHKRRTEQARQRMDLLFKNSKEKK